MLVVFVDYDNMDASQKAAGPVNMAKMLIALIPTATLATYKSVTIRLYGGWRSQASLTTSAQKLVPDIRASSPCIFPFVHAGISINLRLSVELAERPLGASVQLEETLVRDRDLRKFRSRPFPWLGCANHSSCGFSNLRSVTYATTCSTHGCATRFGDILVRDEQKMVDTLIVADIAHQVFVAKTSDVVVVSSDTDMWPGVLLALRAGCRVTHIHTRCKWRTQRHLMNTIIGPLNRAYTQLSI